MMKKKPYHHLPDGTFRNPEGSPKRDPNVKWSYKIFNKEKKKLVHEISSCVTVSRNKLTYPCINLKSKCLRGFAYGQIKIVFTVL